MHTVSVLPEFFPGTFCRRHETRAGAGPGTTFLAEWNSAQRLSGVLSAF
jgi:hypothetical protein